MAIERRPLRAPEVLDAAVKLATARFADLARAILAVGIPVQVLGYFAFLSQSRDPSFFEESPTGPAASDAVLLVATILGGVLEHTAAVAIVAHAYLGQRLPWGEALRLAFRLLPRLLLVSVLAIAGISIGLILLVAPGVYLAVLWAAAIPAVVVEGISAPAALGRSRRLVRGRWGATLGALLLGFVLVFVVYLVTGLLIAFLAGALFLGMDETLMATRIGTALFTLVGLAVSVLTTSLLAAVITVAYFDLRVRQEGLDVELLARAGDAAAPVAEPGVPRSEAGWARPQGEIGSVTDGHPPPEGPPSP